MNNFLFLLSVVAMSAIGTLRAQNFSIDWYRPDTAVGFGLENNTNLSITNGWTSAQETRATNAGQISITIPATTGNIFYRLKNP